MNTGLKRRLKRIIKGGFRSIGLDIRRAKRTRPAGAARSGSGAAVRRKPSPYEHASPENLYDAVDFLRNAAVDEMNRNLQRRIRAEVRDGRPLKIGFLVSDRSKWNMDSVLDEVRKAGWSARVYLCPKQAAYADRDDKAIAYQSERDFFLQVDSDLVDLYDWKEDLQKPVEDLVDADVVFFQQPWGMQDLPRRLAGRALNAYVHYGFMMMANHGQHYHIGSFHPYLWRYFTQTEGHRLLHLENDPSAYSKLVVTGYPKLDVYLSEAGGGSELWPLPNQSARRIIYAPHHAVTKGSLGMSTFAWNHDLLLELARTTPGTQWLYKPHPNLKYAIARAKLMTREEYEAYERAWAELPNAAVYDSGRYFDVFRSSDVLITDCGSFLAEYLPTGNPIIWLVSATSVGLNAVGQSLADGFYQVRTIPELHETYKRVVVAGEDPLKATRERAIERVLPPGGSAALAIVDHLREQLT